MCTSNKNNTVMLYVISPSNYIIGCIHIETHMNAYKQTHIHTQYTHTYTHIVES